MARQRQVRGSIEHHEPAGVMGALLRRVPVDTPNGFEKQRVIRENQNVAVRNFIGSSS